MHTVQSQLPLRIVKTPSAADPWYPPPSEPTSQPIDPPQETTGQEDIGKIALLLVPVSVILYFCWPIVFHACDPFLPDFNAIEYVLLGAGSLLWLISCVVVSILSTAVFAVRSDRLRIAMMAGWILGFPLLFIYCIPLQYSIEPDWLAPYMSWLTFYFLIPSALLWFLLCCGIYDTLFTMMETRWPATKIIRPIIWAILKSLQQHPHGS
jgi:hypothetical protein